MVPCNFHTSSVFVFSVSVALFYGRNQNQLHDASCEQCCHPRKSRRSSHVCHRRIGIRCVQPHCQSEQLQVAAECIFGVFQRSWHAANCIVMQWQFKHSLDNGSERLSDLRLYVAIHGPPPSPSPHPHGLEIACSQWTICSASLRHYLIRKAQIRDEHQPIQQTRNFKGIQTYCSNDFITGYWQL